VVGCLARSIQAGALPARSTSLDSRRSRFQLRGRTRLRLSRPVKSGFNFDASLAAARRERKSVRTAWYREREENGEYASGNRPSVSGDSCDGRNPSRQRFIREYTMRNLASILLDRMRRSQINCSIECDGKDGFQLKVGDNIYCADVLCTEEAVEKFLEFHIGEMLKKVDTSI
jgi:hypothetical protein